MIDPAERTARNRYHAIVAVHAGATLGAIFGVVLAARSHTLEPKLIGGAIVLAAFYVMAVVPKALAHRWRTPES